LDRPELATSFGVEDDRFHGDFSIRVG